MFGYFARSLAREISTGLFGICPRCQENTIYDGFLSIKHTCNVCGLRHAEAEPNGAFVVGLTAFGSLSTVLFIVWLDFSFAMSNFLFLLAFFLFIAVICFFPLHFLQGFLLASRFCSDCAGYRAIKMHCLTRRHKF